MKNWNDSRHFLLYSYKCKNRIKQFAAICEVIQVQTWNSCVTNQDRPGVF